MDDGGWRRARLTPEQMEERRLVAAALLRQGRLSQAALARQFGVSGASVCPPGARPRPAAGRHRRPG